jgi:hypothetical protein
VLCAKHLYFHNGAFDWNIVEPDIASQAVAGAV